MLLLKPYSDPGEAGEPVLAWQMCPCGTQIVRQRLATESNLVLSYPTKPLKFYYGKKDCE